MLDVRTGDGASDEGFVVTNEMGRGGVSMLVAETFASSSAVLLPGMPFNPDKSYGAFPII